MTVLDGFFQGIIQGATEFLPVSSDGHLTLYQHFTGNSGEGALFFSLMLHLGTLVAVFAVYYKDIWQLQKKPKVLGFANGFLGVAANDSGQFVYMLEQKLNKILACNGHGIFIPHHQPYFAAKGWLKRQNCHLVMGLFQNQLGQYANPQPQFYHG